MFCAHHSYCLGDQIKEDEMGRVCGMWLRSMEGVL